MPSIGKDLAAIRSHLGLTIQDIQYATKIPVSTLKTIENDSIFTMQNEGKTYIRSFVRSYGRALKIDDDILVKALDQYEDGNYNDLLLQGYQALANKKEDATGELLNDRSPLVTDSSERPVDESDKKDLFSETGRSVKTPPDEISSEEVTDSVKEPGALTEEQSIEGIDNVKTIEPVKSVNEPSINSVDWANMGQKYSNKKTKAPAWLISLIILAVIAAAGIYVLYTSGILGSDDSEIEPVNNTENQATRGGLSLDLDEPITETTEQEIAGLLDDVLYVTIYAAFERLDPVRVWSDLKPRLDPYWLEQGSAIEFEFADTVRIRGNYSNMLLFKNGHLIHNFFDELFNDEENAVELTRSFFSSDTKWATPISFELPEGVAEPDSIVQRPTF
ncbi:MAG: hypothetical protein EA359_07460 [Balneolaceae bacterium]|nr:MAG: hypothetical protein EA359_07460 [Balneolaceae bacterium]